MMKKWILYGLIVIGLVAMAFPSFVLISKVSSLMGMEEMPAPPAPPQAVVGPDAHSTSHGGTAAQGTPQSVQHRKPVKPVSASAKSVQLQGPVQTKKGMLFQYYAPEAAEVMLQCDFNDNKPVAMTRRDDGVWEAAVKMEPGNYTYRFRVGDSLKEDPSNPVSTESENGRVSIVIVY